MNWHPCEFCQVYNPTTAARCFNCGEPFEEFEEEELMTLDEFSGIVLSQKKLEQLQRQPIIETKIFKSKDNRFIITKTTITDIKPTTYYKKVIG